MANVTVAQSRTEPPYLRLGKDGWTARCRPVRSQNPGWGSSWSNLKDTWPSGRRADMAVVHLRVGARRDFRRGLGSARRV